MRALFLNWRCTKHPKAGGAEYVTMQLAQALVEKGWEVYWFSASAKGLPRTETLDGVKMVRAGGPLTVQLYARRWYAQQQKGFFDFVLDQSHGVPFFAPSWVHEPCIYFIHEVTGKIAPYMAPWPFGWLYMKSEPYIIRYYAKTPALTVSQSTANEMRQYGHTAPITVLTSGLDSTPLKQLPAISTKEKNLTVIMAARLVPLKRPDQAIRMLAHLIKLQPKAQLWIVGSGEERYVRYLKKLAQRLGVEKQATFFGFVTHAKREELMQRAHILTVTSVKEGWGLTVPESNAVGTVAVTYNIGGVRDSNRDGITGVLSRVNTPEDLANCIYELYTDTDRYAALRQNALDWVKTLQWSKPKADFIRAVEAVTTKHHDGAKANS